MSGGVNVKSGPHAPASSGIPLPHSMLPSSPKVEPRHRASDLPRHSTQTPKYNPTHITMHSPSLCLRSSSIPGPTQDLLRDPGLKSPLIKRAGALPAPQVSCSAYSSPLSQRRVPPPQTKDAQDQGKTSPPNVPSHDGNRNRKIFANKNQTCITSHLRPPLLCRRGDNTNTVCQATTEAMPQREEEAPQNHPARSGVLNNSNLHSTVTDTNYEDTIKRHSGSTSQSDEEMGTPEDSPGTSSCPLPPIIFTTPIMSKVEVDMLNHSLSKEAASTETHTPRINMATVAPFSYRQVVCTHTHTHTF